MESDVTIADLNPRLRLRCLACGHQVHSTHVFRGCPSCGSPVEAVYEGAEHGPVGLMEAVAFARTHLQPLPAQHLVDLGRVVTPLIPAPDLGRHVVLKNESLSPTGAHKDRYHAVAGGVARLLQAPGIVTTSTGNHGAAAVAHAAAAGLRAVVFCHREAPEGLLRMLAAFGGAAAQLEQAEQREALLALVDRVWFPATSMDPALSGASNPFGAEGFKTIAYEVLEQLGRMPQAMVLPVAGGDTLYGVAKGFAEVATLPGESLPLLIGAQPEVANSLVRSMRAGHPVAAPNPASIALSVSDRLCGRQAMVALQRWGGAAVDVSEDAIIEAVRALAAKGLYVEPASAVSLAGYRAARGRGLVGDSDIAVLLLTSTAMKWPEAMARIFPVAPLLTRSDLERSLAAGSP